MKKLKLENARLSYLKHDALLLPTQYNVENQEKLQALVSLHYCMWGQVRLGLAFEVVFASGLCSKAPKVQICPLF